MAAIGMLEGSKNFQQVIADPRRTVVIKFYASWCGACKMMAPHYARIANEFSPDTLTFYRLDCDANKDLTKMHNIDILPTFIVYRGGEVIYRQSGTVHEKLKKALMELPK